MEFNQAVIFIGILFIPGIVAAWIYRRYGSQSKTEEGGFFVQVFVFGVICFSITNVVYRSLGHDFRAIYLITGSFRPHQLSSISLDVLLTSVSAIFVASFSLLLDNYRIIGRLLKTAKITKRFGREDVWNQTFNSKAPHVEYVHYYDFHNERIYCGWVKEFSESENLRELLLENVVVIMIGDGKTYKSPFVYVADDPNKMRIEFPYRSKEDQKTLRESEVNSNAEDESSSESNSGREVGGSGLA